MAEASLRRKYKSWSRLPALARALLPLVWLALAVSRLLVVGVSFRRLEPMLGTRLGPAAWIPLITLEQQARAQLIGLTVRLASSYTPWQSTCFDQAIVARVLLGLYRIPYAIFFGVQRQPNEQALKAHAWLSAGPIYVVGGNGFGKFAVVNTVIGGLPKFTPTCSRDECG